jgi:catechol 2,3-dioxygenase-like lactoylglutathione lyase family enzyme
VNDFTSLRFDHVNISVTDLDAQEEWYSEALGLSRVVERVEIPDPPVRTVILEAPEGLRVELIERKGSSRASVPGDPLEASETLGYGHWALRVEDLGAIFDQLTAGGASVVSAPAEAATPGGRFAYVKDPEGNLIELVQRPGEPAGRS